jgi:hypothetical protein
MRLVSALACVCACSASSGSGSSDGGAPLGDAASGSSSGASSGSSGATTDSGSSGSSGSSSGGSGDGGNTSVYCSVTTNGVLKSCAAYTNVPASDTSGFTQSCTFEKGTIVSSCPSTNEVGCCQQTADQITTSVCFYCGAASTYESACTSGAIWTAGSGGAATCDASGDGGSD